MDQSVSRRRKLVVAVIGSLVAVLVIVGTIAALRGTTNTCLTPKDYQDLYGEVPLESHFSPATSFFHKYYAFQPNSVVVDTDNSDSPAIDASILARFYQARTAQPMVFTITGVYDSATSSSKKIAEQRVALIASALTKAGIPDSLVTTSISTYSTSKDDERPDATNDISLTLKSTGNCTE